MILQLSREYATLECAMTFYNKRAVVKLEKHITSAKEKRYIVGEKRKKIHVSSNRERIGRTSILHTARAALKETRLLSFNKTMNYF